MAFMPRACCEAVLACATAVSSYLRVTNGARSVQAYRRAERVTQITLRRSLTVEAGNRDPPLEEALGLLELGHGQVVLVDREDERAGKIGEESDHTAEEGLGQRGPVHA